MSELTKAHPMRDAVVVASVFALFAILFGAKGNWIGVSCFSVLTIVLSPLAYLNERFGWEKSSRAKRIACGLLFVVFVVIPCWVMIGSVDGESSDDADLAIMPTDAQLDAETAAEYDERISKMWDSFGECATRQDTVEAAFSNGNYAAVLSCISNQLHEGCQILQSATSISEYHAGTVMVGTALSKIRVAMGKHAFPGDAIDVAEKLVDEVQGADPACCKRAIRLDYVRQRRARDVGMWFGWLEDKLLRFLFGNYFLHPNDTLSLMAAESRAGLSAFDSKQCIGEVDRPTLGGMIDLMRPNGIGRCLASAFAWEVRNVLHSALHETQRAIVAARITIAVTRYKNKRGAMPKDMNELIPGYLKAIPSDPCSGRPVQVDMAKNAMKFGLDDGWHVYPRGDSADE